MVSQWVYNLLINGVYYNQLTNHLLTSMSHQVAIDPFNTVYLSGFSPKIRSTHIHIPGTQMTLVLIGKGLVLGG